MKEINSVLVLGGGSAGLLAALTVRRLAPAVSVHLVHSPEIGVIGVGEGTTAVFPDHLFNTLGIPRERFYREAQPTWKQGIRFLWGERGDYFYDFNYQYDLKFEGMAHATGFYAGDDCHDLNTTCALMRRGKAFLPDAHGKPDVRGEYAFHIENKKFVRCLENIAREYGVAISEDTLEGVERDPVDGGVAALVFASGLRATADLFVDASGFRAELIGRVLEEPFQSFSPGLFCDRAVIGGWTRREDEPCMAYTTAETMDSGWCWKIEHENFINRGYVYSSAFIGDDEAERELTAWNPRIETTPRVVKFRSGRYRRNWVKNVVAIGNSSGFVEPLEATAIAQIIYESRWLAEVMRQTNNSPGDSVIEQYNDLMARAWDEIRDFLAYHYKFNRRLSTPFWRHCQEETSLGNFEGFYQAYRRLGPAPQLIHALPHRPNLYGIEGFLTMLVGMKVPHQAPVSFPDSDWEIWQRERSAIGAAADRGLSVQHCLDAIRSPDWQWS